ncbi:replication initiation protein [Herbidospora sp. NEAU-GS84]|uniref:Replication initiation protein n=1 Tax=Herbidospora solisilvae TaxID=2696284 RepID=A0A7C9N0E9_9ACTN|nr:replication initiator [Herbidospora solisilvae]NAS22149.1 replication initiation protein [Herbidospora solisilvae]
MNQPCPSRLTRPLARDVAEEIAKQHGVCIRPVALKRMDILTGRTDMIDAPCGATLESKCPPCATRNRQLRRVQCREGWHADEEPINTPDDADDYQRYLVALRADAQGWRDAEEKAGRATADLDAAIADLDEEIIQAGMRGKATGRTSVKRSRSTRRRQDAPDLPRRQMTKTTLGRTFTGPNGKTYRPSMFVTLTLPSYGKILDAVPRDPDRYDYTRAARDALHFSRLVDRFVQNLRRVAGYDVQYFATVEPQKRLTPHLHMAIRGTLPRAELRQIIAATYHQVWWPSTDTIRFDSDHLPEWVDGIGYLDPRTGEILPTWDQALDQLGPDPQHVVRFGDQADIQSVLAGTPDADQLIRYLSKYLSKSLGDPLGTDDPRRRAHAERFLDALRFEPCAPTCPNWLRYGVQPKNAKPGMAPGRCKGKAHKPEHLGYAGRRVLVSRKWSNKTLAEHRRDRRTWVLEALGQEDEPVDPHRYVWQKAKPGDPGLAPIGVRLLRSVHERQRWRNHLDQLQALAEGRAA